MVSKQKGESKEAWTHKERTWKTCTQRPPSDMFRRADSPRGDSSTRKVRKAFEREIFFKSLNTLEIFSASQSSTKEENRKSHRETSTQVESERNYRRFRSTQGWIHLTTSRTKPKQLLGEWRQWRGRSDWCCRRCWRFRWRHRRLLHSYETRQHGSFNKLQLE